MSAYCKYCGTQIDEDDKNYCPQCGSDGSGYRPEAGWAWPLTAKKAHYFDKEGRALCRRWLFFGKLEEGNDESPDNCLECRKQLTRLRASKTGTPQCQ